MNLRLSHTLIAVYLSSNILFTFLPKTWFSNSKLFYSLLIFDTGIVSFGMNLSERMTTDFYLVSLLIILLAFYGPIVQTLTKEIEQEITISEDKYRGLIKNANEGIILLRNPQLIIADMNREGRG